MSKYKYAVLDIETTGLNRFKHKITWIGVGLAESFDGPLVKKYLLDMRNDRELAKWLALYQKLKRYKLHMITQNGKFDVLFIEHHTGVRVPINDDIMLLGTAYDMAASHKLEDMAVKYLGVKTWKIDKKTLVQGKRKDIVPYLTKDLENPWGLFKFFKQNLTTEKWKHYNHILRPSYLAYRDIERTGIYLHKKRYKAAQMKYTQLAETRRKALQAKHDINWDSSPQLAKVLFEVEGLPVIKRSEKTNKPSADAYVLKRLAADGYTLPQEILEYRDANTAVKMFLSRWEQDAAFDGRIHPSFGLTNVRTGRTSCSDPNLQQVPRKKDIRSCFTAPPPSKTGGKRKVFFEADYSQLELRIATEYSRDPTLLRIYDEDGDVHQSTARIVTNRPEPTKDDRTKAKPVNFGFLYGQGAMGFTNYAFSNYGVVFTLAESRNVREGFFGLYSQLEPWHREMEQRCEAQGGVANKFGRFRALPDIYSSDRRLCSAAKRRAINTPVQSTGSDLLICSMAELHRKYSKEGLVICGSIHDALVGECWEEDQKYMEKVIIETMVKPKVLDIFGVEFRVPIKVDIGWGAWGSK